MARRLGFDLLQSELRGIDQYLSVPSLPVAWLERPYADYCRELAALKGLPEPAARDWQALEAAGMLLLNKSETLDATQRCAVRARLPV
ncbi:hypothetical protein ACM6PT_35925, partial [Klebsiella pneumoniae]